MRVASFQQLSDGSGLEANHDKFWRVFMGQILQKITAF